MEKALGLLFNRIAEEGPYSVQGAFRVFPLFSAFVRLDGRSCACAYSIDLYPYCFISLAHPFIKK